MYKKKLRKISHRKPKRKDTNPRTHSASPAKSRMKNVPTSPINGKVALGEAKKRRIQIKRSSIHVRNRPPAHLPPSSSCGVINSSNVSFDNSITKTLHSPTPPAQRKKRQLGIIITSTGTDPVPTLSPSLSLPLRADGGGKK